MLDLPKSVVFCKKCLVSNQKPNSTVEIKSDISKKKSTQYFDNNGICVACNYSELKKNKIDWEKREKELLSLLEKYRKYNGDYDCIVPGSGGKDSCYVSHLLKYKYKMNPLTVTWAPHEFTKIGQQNFNSWLNSGFDNIFITPNRGVHRKLTKYSFLNLLHPFQPFIVGQKMTAPKIALKYKIPLIFYGENPAEYGNNLDDNYNPLMDIKYFTTEKKEKENFFLSGYSKAELINNKIMTENDFNFYSPIVRDEVIDLDLKVYYMSYFLKWDPQDNYFYAATNCGFRPAEQRTVGSYSKYSSIDDKIDMFHYYTLLIKFGIGRATYDASQEIRNDRITRKEGISLVKSYDTEFPERYFQDFLNYMEISENEFWEAIEKFRSNHLWMKKDGNWELKHPVWKDNGL